MDVREHGDPHGQPRLAGPGRASEAVLRAPVSPPRGKGAGSAASGVSLCGLGIGLARSVRFAVGSPRTPPGSRSPDESPARMPDVAAVCRERQPGYPPMYMGRRGSWISSAATARTVDGEGPGRRLDVMSGWRSGPAGPGSCGPRRRPPRRSGPRRRSPRRCGRSPGRGPRGRARERIDRCPQRAGLLEDVHAVLLPLDHPADAANLALDPARRRTSWACPWCSCGGSGRRRRDRRWLRGGFGVVIAAMIPPGGIRDKAARRGRSIGGPGTLPLGWIRWITSSRSRTGFDAPSATSASPPNGSGSSPGATSSSSSRSIAARA